MNRYENIVGFKRAAAIKQKDINMHSDYKHTAPLQKKVNFKRATAIKHKYKYAQRR